MAAQSNIGSDLVITRIFDAPKEVVWKAWTEPEQVKRWWGPSRFTAPVVKIDFRVGGKYLSCMRSPDGKDYWSTGIYKEIIPYEKIVYTDSFADENGNVVPASHYGMGDGLPDEFLVTVTFEEEDRKTKLTLRHSGFPDGDMKKMAGQGWNESLDKFEQAINELQVKR